MKDKLISLIAQTCDWHKTVNEEYIGECESRIYKLEQMLPHGSGIDSGCTIDVERSSSDRVVIRFSYHHMNDNGYYVGWNGYRLIVTPKLWNDFDSRIVGKDRNFVKDYLYEVFNYALKEEVEL